MGLPIWGPAKTTERRLFGEKHWNEPRRWNRKAAEAGRRERVFCASMADVFEDHPQLPPEREKLWRLIEDTPALDWQLLTKRPENIMSMVPTSWRDEFPRNVWIGTSAEDQKRWDERIPILTSIPAHTAFVSAEPLLGPIVARPDDLSCLEWVIIGGESGHGARPMDLAWARSLLAQCRSTETAPFVKQLGAAPVEECEGDGPTGRFRTTRDGRRQLQRTVTRLRLRDKKGGNWSEWPEDLRVREFPEAPHA